MDMLDKRMNDKGKNWRHVLKSLKVLDYILHEGSELVVTWARKNLFIIKTLREFQYTDEDGRDVGVNIRTSAKELTSLILDEERLRAERHDRKLWKSRVTGLDEGMSYGSHANDRPDPSASRRERRRTNRNNEEDDLELRLAIEASKNELEEEKKRRDRGEAGQMTDDDLAKAIRLSKEEEELRRRELEEQNAASLFDDTPTQQAQPTGWNQGTGINRLHANQTGANPFIHNQFTGVPQPQMPSQTGFGSGYGNAEFNIYPQRDVMRGLWSTPHDAQGDHHRDPEEMLRVALNNFRHLTIIPASRNPFTDRRSRRSHLSACTMASMVKETISRRKETHHRGDYAQMRIVVSFHVNDFFAPPVADWGAAQSIIAPVQIMGLESPSFDILRNYFADTNGQSPWMAHIRTRVPHVPVSSGADQLRVNRDYLARLEQLFANATESLGLSELNYKFIKAAAAIPSIFAQTERFYDLSGSLTYLSCTALSLYLPTLRARVAAAAAGGVKPPFPSLLASLAGSGGPNAFNWRQVALSLAVAVWATRPFFAQATWVSLCLLPVLAINSLPASTFAALGGFVSITDVIGLALYVGGISFEATADKQKSNWAKEKQEKKHSEEFLTRGLWSKSRHPNYFGEVTLWTGIATLSAGVLASSAALSTMGFASAPIGTIAALAMAGVSPGFVSFLLFKVSGIPLSENKYDKKFKDNQDYQKWKRETPMFFPKLW
ncbi:hypothetical protein FH972_021119 [Carpinus fangiana]|uniref:ENTH domain-containing protein n=1 Tax=Carpinus fangiana TaxID=176857 RepID=A0A5N6KP12_9ROSI|nr:hypothetical protein FH972_021119 [Carpinus fangiana]